MVQVPSNEFIFEATILTAKSPSGSASLAVCWFDRPRAITANGLAKKLSKLSGIHVTADDYKTWLNGKGKGDAQLFQKAAKRLFNLKEWVAVDAGNLTDAAIQYLLFGETSHPAGAAKKVHSILAGG